MLALIRLIVSDLDGTLCDGAHGLDDMTARYIKLIEEKGYHFMIASGRDYSIIKPLFDTFHFRCDCIALNGAIMFDQDGTVVKEHFIEQGVLKEIAHISKDEDLVIWYTKEGNYCEHPEAYYQMLKEHVPIDMWERFSQEHGFVSFHEQLSLSDVLSNQHVYKVDIHNSCSSTQQHLKLLPNLSVLVNHMKLLEITASGVNKGAMVINYCAKQHIGSHEVLCFGDSENDRELLLSFPYGHIMRNARVLLDQVNYIAPVHDQHGVIRVIEKFTGVPIVKVREFE